MKDILPIGTIVKLNGGKRKVLIVSRFGLYQLNGETGYLEYTGILYPEGLMNQDYYYFNSEDIAEICFEGHVDRMEKRLVKGIKKEIPTFKYRKITTQEITESQK